MRQPRGVAVVKAVRLRRAGRSGFLAGTALAALLALNSCNSSPASNSGSGGSGKPAAPVNVNLVLDWTWQPYHVPFMYGIAHGIYKAHGISLTLTQGQGSSTTATLVGQGKYPFGFADTSTAVIAQNKGVPVKNVMVIQQRGAFATECFKSAHVTSPAGLKGHSVIMIPSESTAQIWPAYLAANHVTAGGIKVVSASVTDKVTLFVAHKADCMAGLLGEDTLQASLENKAIGAPMPWADSGIKLFGYSIISSDSVISSQPGLVKDFVAATAQAWRESCGDQSAAVALFEKMYPNLSKTAAEKTYNTDNFQAACAQLQPPSGVQTAPLGASSPAQWQTTVATLEKYAGLSGSKPATAYYTNKFAAGS